MNWISVEDRLPENTDYVLAAEFDAYGDNGMFKAFFINGAWKLSSDGIGVHAGWDGGNAFLDMDVTHWMPLPAPPTGEPQ